MRTSLTYIRGITIRWTEADNRMREVLETNGTTRCCRLGELGRYPARQINLMGKSRRTWIVPVLSPLQLFFFTFDVLQDREAARRTVSPWFGTTLTLPAFDVLDFRTKRRQT